MNVWSLSTNWQQLDQLLEESCGELTPEIEALMGELVTASKDALEGAGFYRNWLKAQVAVCKERRAALAATIESLEQRQERLDAALVVVLKALGKPQKFAEFTLTTQTRESVAFAPKPGVDLIDLPSEFIRIKDPELNLSALKDAHKAGKLPDGVDVEVSSSTGVMLRAATKKTDTDTQTNAA